VLFRSSKLLVIATDGWVTVCSNQCAVEKTLGI